MIYWTVSFCNLGQKPHTTQAPNLGLLANLVWLLLSFGLSQCLLFVGWDRGFVARSLVSLRWSLISSGSHGLQQYCSRDKRAPLSYWAFIAHKAALKGISPRVFIASCIRSVLLGRRLGHQYSMVDSHPFAAPDIVFGQSRTRFERRRLQMAPTDWSGNGSRLKQQACHWKARECITWFCNKQRATQMAESACILHLSLSVFWRNFIY